MFINPKLAIRNNWITGVRDPVKQVQPNATDFTLDKLKVVDTTSAFIGEASKTMRTLSVPAEDENGNWILEGGRVYDGTSDVYVEVPEGCAATLHTRSTFARNGVFIVSGLYDSGYKGHIGFTIYTIGGPVTIEKGTRIGQIALLTADSAGVYAGGYNHTQGTHYTQPQQVDVPVGQRQIPSDPRRTETGMGPLVNGNSQFI